MTNEELESVYERAELHYEQLKDSCHDLFEENKKLKEKLKNIDEFCDRYKECNLDLFDMYKLLDKIQEIIG